MLWTTSSKHDLTSWLWLVSILGPRRLRCYDPWIHDNSHKYLSQLLCEQKRGEITTYLHVYKSETQEPKWPLSTLDVLKKLVFRLSRLSAKSLHSSSEWVIHLQILPPRVHEYKWLSFRLWLTMFKALFKAGSCKNKKKKKKPNATLLVKEPGEIKTAKRSETVHHHFSSFYLNNFTLTNL